MSLEKIVQASVEGKPLDMKEAFEEEINKRVLAALEEKAMKMAMKEADEDEDEDDEEDEDEDDDEDEDEDEE